MAKKVEEKVNWYDEIVNINDRYYEIFIKNGSQEACRIFVRMLREKDKEIEKLLENQCG